MYSSYDTVEGFKPMMAPHRLVLWQALVGWLGGRSERRQTKHPAKATSSRPSLQSLM